AARHAERMGAGGMYDHMGGGFDRYAVDARWLVPHFEKMLYDNAQIPRLFLDLYQLTGSTHHRAVVEETLDYLLREMRHPEGGFFSATDADSEGEEGRFFLWTPAEVARLGAAEDLELVCRYWDITEVGNFEGRNIAHVTLGVEALAGLYRRAPEEVVAALDRARRALYAARATRVPPMRDEKII